MAQLVLIDGFLGVGWAGGDISYIKDGVLFHWSDEGVFGRGTWSMRVSFWDLWVRLGCRGRIAIYKSSI
jgi:hypothetical protein